MDQRTADFYEQILEAITRKSKDLYVMMPGRVVEYDPEAQSVDVQPLPKIIHPGMAIEEMYEYPVIPDVPICFPRTDSTDQPQGYKSIIYLPIQKGTTVALLFCDASLDNFEGADLGSAGATYDPQDVRRHHLADPIAIPGILPYSYPAPATDSSKGTATPGGKVDPHDIRIVLECPDKGIKSEMFLGGDTGDIVLYPSRNVCLGGQNVGNSPVPQGPLYKWLTALLAAFDPFLVKVAADPALDPATKSAATTLGTALSDLIDQFVQDEAPPAGTGIGYGVVSKKVLIP